MIDISDLGLVEPDQVEWDKYEEGGKPLPPKGEYTLKAPAAFNKEDFTKGAAGQLIVKVDSEIVEGPYAGFKLRYQTVSAKKYSNRNASQAGDYLRACGIVAQPKTNAEYAAAIQSTAGRVYRAQLDWSAYDSPTKYEVKGWENFPDNETGGKKGFVLHPERKDEAGQPIRLPARVQVSRYVSKAAPKK